MNLLTIQNTVITDSVVNKNDIKIEDTNIDVTEKTLSIIDLITSGGLGGNLVMGTLAILSIFAIYILIERYSTINKASKEDESFLKSIQNFVEAKDIAAAKTLCKNTNSPISRMIEKGVNRIDKPMTDISSAIENQGKLEVYKMENNLANLATISGAAPMIGFLGTVIGMIVAFHEMASAGGNIDVAMLSQGIYTAMVTTVAGLVVGIIAFIAYNYLVSKVDKVVFMLEAKTIEFLDLIHHNE
ncbi:MAG: MotA/TolQ/ExbB proton channel family protein [Flavobacteriales bacterium]|jgi:biopolymer transport protein ExbB|nr:MotA/TolQ/ExbB proton channel family protein [Flavobacteriales bacterium]MDG1934313.1 MotA/TolQ/ExbB proton channel family protein [Flavobacteriales bacterium]MDG2085781.1 MotA/TolQ/ExbB proton channel family protein [Flavobacteriales bacterium]|tara:strand:- start:651 stop:1379 length:729 start_codon:yes stop_codon:yes gene_type:complete